MRWFDELRLRLRSLFRRSRVERELDDELRFHLEQLEAERVAAGMSASDARATALRDLGGVSQIKEECRDSRRVNLVEDFLRDARYAMRALRKTPGFTFVAVSTLALGIGANTAIFSVVNGVLLRPLPYREPDRIVALNTRFTRENRSIPRITGGDLLDILGSDAFEASSAYFGGELGVQAAGRAEFAHAYWVMPGFTTVFGAAPAYGRLLTAADANRGALVSMHFAERMFGSGPAALGKSISIENRAYEIAGVLPAGFAFPAEAEIWPAAPAVPSNLNRTAYNYRAVARLRLGMTPGGAQARLDTIGSRLAAAFPDSNRHKAFTVVPLGAQLTGDVRQTLWILLGAVVLVLLIACANVASLLLARTTARAREIALRSALGASGARIRRQLIAESGTLAALGGAIGIGLAYAGVAALVRLAPAEIPRLDEVRVDGTVLLFASAISVLASFLFGLAPSWQASRAGLCEALKQGASNLAGGTHRLRTALVIAEISIAFVLAIGAGLLFRSFLALNRVQLGFRPEGLLVMYAHAPAHSLPEAIQATRFFENLVPELAVLPGAKSAAGAMGMPAGKYGSDGQYSIEGRPDPPNPPERHAGFRLAGPGYFAVMGIPLTTGRDFSPRDQYDSPFVAIVSEALARRAFPGEDPLGKRIQCGMDAPGKWMTVVGVVSDVRQRPASAPDQEIYMPLAQHPFFANELQVVLRTAVDPALLAGAVREKVRERNPLVAMSFTTATSMLSDSVAAPRFRTFLIGVFAGLSLLLAMAGVYGVMAYATAQRVPEFGVRMALGARPGEVFRMVLGRASLIAAAGLALGLGGAVAGSRLIRSLLFALKPVDAATYAAIAGCTAAVVLLAAALPAWRAARIDPVRALRQE